MDKTSEPIKDCQTTSNTYGSQNVREQRKEIHSFLLTLTHEAGATNLVSVSSAIHTTTCGTDLASIPSDMSVFLITHA